MGTSAGAITAALVAVGFSGDELARMAVDRTPDDHPLFFEAVSEPLVPMSLAVEPIISPVQLRALNLPTELGRLAPGQRLRFPRRR